MCGPGEALWGQAGLRSGRAHPSGLRELSGSISYPDLPAFAVTSESSVSLQLEIGGRLLLPFFSSEKLQVVPGSVLGVQ